MLVIFTNELYLTGNQEGKGKLKSQHTLEENHAITMLMLVPDLTDWSHQTALLDNNNNVRDHEKTLHEAQNSGIVEQKTKKTNPKALPIWSIPTRGVNL